MVIVKLISETVLEPSEKIYTSGRGKVTIVWLVLTADALKKLFSLSIPPEYATVVEGETVAPVDA